MNIVEKFASHRNFIVMNRFFIIVLFILCAPCSANSNESTQFYSGDALKIQTEKKPPNANLTNGPPNSDEIIGYWKQKKWPKSTMNKVNPWPLPFQYFAFYEDGHYVTIMSSSDNPVTPDSLDQLKSTFGAESPNFKWLGKFIMITNPAIDNYSEIWGMNIIRKMDTRLPFGEGDLVMSLAGKNNGSAIYYRWLTRMK